MKARGRPRPGPTVILATRGVPSRPDGASRAHELYPSGDDSGLLLQRSGLPVWRCRAV